MNDVKTFQRLKMLSKMLAGIANRRKLQTGEQYYSKLANIYYVNKGWRNILRDFSLRQHVGGYRKSRSNVNQNELDFTIYPVKLKKTGYNALRIILNSQLAA